MNSTIKQNRTCVVSGIAITAILVCVCITAAVVTLWISDFKPMPETAETNGDLIATLSSGIIDEPSVPDSSIPSTNPSDSDQSSAPHRWLVLLYQDADDEILESDIYMDLNEAELVGSSERVMVVSQLDRYRGAYAGNNDWYTSKRYLLYQDSDLENINSPELLDMGEANMSEVATLVDFVSWGIQNYPADKYVLIMSDHGAGWLGGWTDSDSGDEEGLSLDEIDTALSLIINQTGIGQFELIGFDACLMGQLEVFTTVAPYARYAVASEEVEPTLGWAYAGFLDDLVANPGMDGRELAQSIVTSYIVEDQRVVDDQARLTLLREVFGTNEYYTAAEVAEEMSVDITLSGIDLSKMQLFNQAYNNFVQSLTNTDQYLVARARTYAQTFENVFGDDVPASYIDLGHFADIIKSEAGNAEVSSAADELLSVLQQTVIAEKHGAEKSGASGIAIYFPNSVLYDYTRDTPDNNYIYTTSANRFSSESIWDEFLAYHYSGESFDITGPQPPPEGMEIIAPGAGVITIPSISSSAEVIGIDGIVTLRGTVTGTNIAYIYIDVAYYYEEDDSYLSADMDYIDAPYTKEINGVYYPDWGSSGKVEIDIDWEPTLWYINDGVNSEFALIYPVDYGAPDEDSVYAVDGIYTFGDSGLKRDAIIYFGADSQMREIYGYSGENGTGAMHQITPHAGDQFTILEEWFENGEFVEYEGGTLTFRDQNLFFEAYYAYPGDYIVGFIAEDLDGNWYTSDYVNITIEE